MVLYQQIVIALPKSPPSELTEVMRRYARIIVNSGGVLRGIENHGLRPLSEVTRRKYATIDGQRKFWEARFMTLSFDVAPKVLQEMDRLMKLQQAILRVHTVKMKSGADYVRTNTWRNPYFDPNKKEVRLVEKKITKPADYDDDKHEDDDEELYLEELEKAYKEIGGDSGHVTFSQIEKWKIVKKMLDSEKIDADILYNLFNEANPKLVDGEVFTALDFNGFQDFCSSLTAFYDEDEEDEDEEGEDEEETVIEPGDSIGNELSESLDEMKKD